MVVIYEGTPFHEEFVWRKKKSFGVQLHAKGAIYLIHIVAYICKDIGLYP